MDAKDKIKRIFKRIVIVVLALVVLIVGFAVYNSIRVEKIGEARMAQYYEEHKDDADKDPNELDFEVADSAEPLEEDTYFISEYSSTIHVYDNDYIEKIPFYSKVSYADLYQALQDNENIQGEMRNTIQYFISRLETVYPDIEIWPLYKNMQTLNVVYCTQEEMTRKSLSFDTAGCYIFAENTIYILDDYSSLGNKWENQAIMHELCHALRSMQLTQDGFMVRTDSGGSHDITILDEALNSLFSVSLLEYEELDIAYQLQSNMLAVVVECADYYDLSDYANHSLSYFMKALDKENGNNNYANSILLLMEAQYNDYHSDDIHREQSVYYPLYDYITKMYLDQYATADMSEDELTELVDELVTRIMFDVPEDYEIDTNEFYSYANEYFSQLARTETAA